MSFNTDVGISIGFLKQFINDLNKVFPEKKSFLEKQLSVIESHICTLELQNKNLLSQLEKLQRRNSAVQEEANQGEPKQTLTLAVPQTTTFSGAKSRKDNETIRLPIAGSTSLEEDGKEEQPRHIISKTAEEISCIRTAMKGDGVLRKLSEAQLNALINEFDELKVAPNTTIVQEGSLNYTDRLFIIKSGIVSVLNETQNMYGGLSVNPALQGMKKITKRLKAGDIFGEIALFYSCKRTATVKSDTDAVLWSLKRADFKRVLEATIGSHTLQEKIDIVRSCSHFAAFDKLQLKKVAQCFAEEYFQEGSVVIKQGDFGSRFYIIK